MEARSGLTAKKFRDRLAAARRFTEAIFNRGEHDSLFKGKWYIAFVMQELEVACGGNIFNAGGAEGRLIGSLITSIDFEKQWTDHFRAPLSAALRLL
jgi:hypothetical protein